jgi:hypothetical protein
MEKIDPQYKNHMSIKREINEAIDDTFSFKQLDDFLENEYFEEGFEYCEKHLGPCIGEGSSRGVFQIDDGRCLKIALNMRGKQQNKVESQTNKNNYLLFPLTFEKSKNDYWVVTEYVLPAEEEDFEQCLGIEWWEFCEFIENLNYQKYTKYKDDYLMEIIENDRTGTLRSLYDYIVKYRTPCGDMLRICNWGMTVRNGKETLVLLDSGWNKETMRMYGGSPSSTKSGYSDKISYNSSDF